VPRYRFGDFTLSTRTRMLSRQGRPVPLIPRYLDLLIFLVERRSEAVHRRDIFDRVWSDVIVSDSALSQAIRTLRRTLGDDPREPRFIRTVSRHGYQFTYPHVIEEPDEDLHETAPTPASAHDGVSGKAEQHEQVRQKAAAAVAAVIAGAARASAGGAIAGLAAGAAGGLLLHAAPGNTAPLAIVPVLALVGASAGAAGGLGIGAGLAAAESSSRLRRAAGLMLGAATGGTVIGVAVQWLMRWSLAALVGLQLPIGGLLEGLLVGGAAGAGYALARRPVMAARSRVARASVLALSCASATLLLAWMERPLVGGTLHLVSREARGSQVSLAPLGRLVGEPGFGPLTQAVLAAWEGGMFGLGVGLALVRHRSHARLTRPSSIAHDVPAV
jgi:DNA-binding winged helix-turn-helix (wHTH) protein